MSARDIVLSGGGSAAPTYVDDVFSTYLYAGNTSTQTITNGIDLAGKGGMVWIKNRTGGPYDHMLLDTARGSSKYLSSNTTAAGLTNAYQLYSFNSNGFTLGDGNYTNNSAATYASWTFRKAAKFFDVVTYTGNGTATNNISHSLDSVPGFIIAKRTDSTSDWVVCNRYSDTNWQGGNGGAYDWRLNLTEGAGAGVTPTDRQITSTTVNVTRLSGTVAGGFDATAANVNGATYVMYLFAHNAGGFGLTGTDNVISCGSFTGDANGNATVSLGYEPQWLMFKRTDAAADWNMRDNMRGFFVKPITTSRGLKANLSAAEGDEGDIRITNTGFSTEESGGLAPSGTYIYIAIRRPMKTPTVGTQVYYGQYGVEPITSPFVFNSPFPPDLLLTRFRDTQAWSHYTVDRLRGHSMALETASYGATTNWSSSPYIKFDGTGGVAYIPTAGAANNSGGSGLNTLAHAFKRAPGFFDIVCYTGTGTDIGFSHNLTVAPELTIIKRRDVSNYWQVFPPTFAVTEYLELNTTGGKQTWPTLFMHLPSATLFYPGSFSTTNGSGGSYVAYLFATLAGISKVGSYTGNGSSQTIACGFAYGARFILIKRTGPGGGGDWYVWNSTRGIISANDPHLSLNTTATEVSTDDSVDPANSGFIVNQVSATDINVTSATYIFLAIA